MKIFRRETAWAALVLAADQGAKLLASRIALEPLVLIPGFFRLILSRNTGALFGWLGRAGEPWRTGILIGVPIVAGGAVFFLLDRLEKREVFARIGLALILGGTVGNVLDRIFRGYVLDFLDFYVGWEPLARPLIRWFGTNRWHTFNIADVGLTLGVALVAFEIFFRRKTKSKSRPGKA